MSAGWREVSERIIGGKVPNSCGKTAPVAAEEKKRSLSEIETHGPRETCPESLVYS